MGVQCALCVEWCGKDWCLAQGCEMSKNQHVRHLTLRPVGPAIEPRMVPLIVQTMRVFARADFKGFILENTDG